MWLFSPLNYRSLNRTASTIPNRRTGSQEHGSLQAHFTTSCSAKYLRALQSRPIATTAGVDELRRRLTKPLPESGMAPEAVLNDLVRDAEGGLLGSASGRATSRRRTTRHRWPVFGMRVMRVSVCNWLTTGGGVDQTLGCVRDALAAAPLIARTR